jgi:aminoglycoside phosphotransferase (APT) family kinase protein
VHNPQIIAWIERSLGPGASVVTFEGKPATPWFAEKHLIEVDLNNGLRRRFMLRRFHNAKRRAHDPWYNPANEALALRLLADSGVPAPRLQAVDLEGAACGVPLLLESWLHGSSEWYPGGLDGYLARVAEVLVAIHAVSVPPGVELARYAPYNEGQRVGWPPFTTRPGLWENVANALDAPRPADRETFIHRDYHPGNVLLDGRKMTGVVDWLTAAWGPPGIDLARMRVNLVFEHGRDVADRFVDAYVATGGDPSARNPYWDLLDAADLLSHLTPEPSAAEVSQFEDYVESLLGEVR